MNCINERTWKKNCLMKFVEGLDSSNCLSQNNIDCCSCLKEMKTSLQLKIIEHSKHYWFVHMHTSKTIFASLSFICNTLTLLPVVTNIPIRMNRMTKKPTRLSILQTYGHSLHIEK